MASTYLQRTQASATGTAAQKFTFSAWVKKCKNGANQGLYGNTYSSTHRAFLYFDSSDRFTLYDSSGTEVATSALLRDVNAFYHVVCSVDTTQSTASDRVKLYINGVLQTALNANTYPSQNQDLKLMNTTNTPRVGAYDNGSGTVNYFEGVMSHVHFTQGYSYDASTFGETDSTTGEWKINTSPTVANYGTNGFWILKDGNSVTDQSPNSNNWTVTGGTLTKTEDNPSNVFATWNPLFPAGGTLGYDFGNTKLTNSGTAAYRTSVSTLGASTGKFYAEFKCEGDTFFTGVLDINDTKMGINDTTFGSSSNMTAYGYGIFNSTGNVSNNGSTVVSGYSAALANGDILGVALDATNKKLYFAKNGVWQNSGVPTSGSTGTGAISLASGDRTWVFASSVNGTNISANFGNGYFKSTAISSAGTNASGIGIFEYDVPAGYTALCTKGLNE